MGCRGLNPGQLRARQTPYVLCYRSGPTFFSFNNMKFPVKYLPVYSPRRLFFFVRPHQPPNSAAGDHVMLGIKQINYLQGKCMNPPPPHTRSILSPLRAAVSLRLLQHRTQRQQMSQACQRGKNNHDKEESQRLKMQAGV